MGVPWPRCSESLAVTGLEYCMWCNINMFEQEGMEWVHRAERLEHQRRQGPGGRNRPAQPAADLSSSDEDEAMPELVDVHSSTGPAVFTNVD